MSDMHRVYVAERATGPDAQHLTWWSIGTYSTQDEAIRHASEAKAYADTRGVRVRQFWIQSTISPVLAKMRADYPDAYQELVTYVCPDHAARTIRWSKDGQAPRCPDCHTTMVPKDFADAPIIDIKDLA